MGLVVGSNTTPALKCSRQKRAANSVTLLSWTMPIAELGAAWQLGAGVGLIVPVARVELVV